VLAIQDIVVSGEFIEGVIIGASISILTAIFLNLRKVI
jgi:F0F1-type ATP synthase assembly protein I